MTEINLSQGIYEKNLIYLIFVFNGIEFPGSNEIRGPFLILILNCEWQYKREIPVLFALLIFMEDLFSTFGANLI